MIIAFVQPHYCQPRNEDSRQRITRVAVEASQRANDIGATHDVITPIKVEFGAPPYAKAVLSGLDSEPGIAQIKESLQKKECTILIGSPIEIRNALTRLEVATHGIIDTSVPVFSATLTSLIAA